LRIICAERPSLKNKLTSSAIHDRLREEGVELPDYAIYDALDMVKPMVRYFLGGPQNPDDPADEAAVRRHGGITVVDVDTDLCDEF
jgi:hypothetical protein